MMGTRQYRASMKSCMRVLKPVVETNRRMACPRPMIFRSSEQDEGARPTGRFIEATGRAAKSRESTSDTVERLLILRLTSKVSKLINIKQLVILLLWWWAAAFDWDLKCTVQPAVMTGLTPSLTMTMITSNSSKSTVITGLKNFLNFSTFHTKRKKTRLVVAQGGYKK
jgi:hypothetical protein